MKSKLYLCDSTKKFPLKNNSVDCIITSPPYWQLKDYNTYSAQCGRFDTYENYHNKLNCCWSECYRVLRPGRHCCIVASDLKTLKSEYQVIPINTHIISNMYFFGWIYEGSIIWKKTARNGTVPNNKFPCKVRYNYEMINIFRKPGPFQHVNCYMEPVEKGIVWTPNPKQHKHPAAYPIAIPSQLITMYTMSGRTILDPFHGTGTTQHASKRHNCNYIGFDNSKEYLKGQKYTTIKHQEPVLHTTLFNDSHKLVNLRGDLKII